MSDASGVAGGLRERKKTLTRDTIEGTALRQFLERGYDRVRIEDICADSLVSPRTFFRYFASKEDLVFGRLRAHLAQAEQLLAVRPAEEPILDTLRAVIRQVVEDYVAEPDRELRRLRLVTTTAVLETGLLTIFAGFENLVRGFAATRMDAAPDTQRPRLLAAAVVAAFRVGLQIWIDSAAGLELANLIAGNMEILTRALLDEVTATPPVPPLSQDELSQGKPSRREPSRRQPSHRPSAADSSSRST